MFFIGSIPGAETKLPFICPADHVIAIERLSPRDANVFGPDLTGFREYSFLKNPRTPKAILEDKFVLRVCAEGNDACANQAATGAGTGAPIVVIDQRLDETNMLEVREIHCIDYSIGLLILADRFLSKTGTDHH